ncbi:MAG: hypothetical protein OXI30_05845 [Chloroflexota bacterium]|nr:hypothetical protein [Chloroflexota bacterium]
MSKFRRPKFSSLLISAVLCVAVLPVLAQRFTAEQVREPEVSLVAVMPGHTLMSSDEYEVRTASCNARAAAINKTIRLSASAKIKKGTKVIYAIEGVWGSWPDVVSLEWPQFAHKGHLNQFANVQWGSNRAEIGMEGKYVVKNDRGKRVGQINVKAACQAKW